MENKSNTNVGQNSKNNNVQEKPTLGFRDVGEFIMKLIIAILIIIGFITYYTNSKDTNPLAWLIFILLLLLIIWLIIRQRHFISLNCDLTAPHDCIKGDTNIINGKVLEPVVGTADGLGFDHYLLEVRDPNGILLNDVAIYANSSGLPDISSIQGSFAKTSTILGWIDVKKAINDAGNIVLTSTIFQVTLRVFGVDGSEKTPNCQISFSLSANEVFIKEAGGTNSNNYIDTNEPLRTASASATIGGNISVKGAANIYGCTNEKIAEYSIWMIQDPTFSFVQPPRNTSVIPTSSWHLVTKIPFTGVVIPPYTYTADDQRRYNLLNGDPTPSTLTNNWSTREEHIWILGTLINYKVPHLAPFNYATSSLPKLLSIHEGAGTGKYTILLQVIDTAGNTYYDVQRAWIDNEPIHAKIEGIKGLSSCTDLFTKDATGNFITVEVIGTAWDQLIDLADSTKPTSDNFDSYDIYFNKQGAAVNQLLKHSDNPVPARPFPVNFGVLADWNLQTLDKKTNPDNRPEDQLLERGEGCTYDILLVVKDKTQLNDTNITHNSGLISFPIKIIN
jgi:hypothetical protein